jgi:hypothetical protein
LEEGLDLSGGLREIGSKSSSVGEDIDTIFVCDSRDVFPRGIGVGLEMGRS